MCLSPLTIPNPFYGLGNKGVNCLRNTHDTHISVPCGNCSQCVSMRQMWFTQRVQMESLRSHLFMLTLTYCDNALCFTDIGDYHIAYPNYTDVQKMLKRVRKSISLRYWFVSEYGTRSFRPHFHALIALDKSIYTDNILTLENRLQALFMREWRRNISTDKFNPIYIPLCKFVRRGKESTFDLHHIEPVPGHDNDCSFYVSKYISKYDERLSKLLAKIQLDPNLSDEETKQLCSLIRVRSVMSKDFGSYDFPPVRDYILKCLNASDKLPQYFDINTGKPSLLSPYYRKHLLSFRWYVKRFVKYSTDPYSYMVDDDLTALDHNCASFRSLELSQKFEKVKKLLQSTYI